jgi:hypothetical protein
MKLFSLRHDNLETVIVETGGALQGVMMNEVLQSWSACTKVPTPQLRDRERNLCVFR